MCDARVSRWTLSLLDRWGVRWPFARVCMDRASLCLLSQGLVRLASASLWRGKLVDNTGCVHPDRGGSSYPALLSPREKAKLWARDLPWAHIYWLFYYHLPSCWRKGDKVHTWLLSTHSQALLSSGRVKNAASWEKSRQLGAWKAMGRKNNCFQRLARMHMGLEDSGLSFL